MRGTITIGRDTHEVELTEEQLQGILDRRYAFREGQTISVTPSDTELPFVIGNGWVTPNNEMRCLVPKEGWTAYLVNGETIEAVEGQPIIVFTKL